jgi:sugar phosphate permease
VLAGWIVFAVVYAGLALTTSRWLFLALLAVYPLYHAFAESVLRAVVADLVPEELRGTAYGLYHFAVGLTALPASLGFGLLWKHAGAGAAFATSAGIAVVAGLMLLRVRRPPAAG